MRGLLRVVARLAVMVLVMAGVLVSATALGLPTAVVLGSSVTVAGLIGMVGMSRRHSSSASSRRDARIEAVRVAMGAPVHDPNVDPIVAAMAPDRLVDPESLMPRWRRPSLLEARRLDPTRSGRYDRTPLRFTPDGDRHPQRRIVRYAMVSLLDRADEVLGRQLADLITGDEVEVLEAAGPFWEVSLPDGLRGWVHRTTLGAVGAESLSFGTRVVEPSSDTDDVLTAVLSARGLH